MNQCRNSSMVKVGDKSNRSKYWRKDRNWKLFQILKTYMYKPFAWTIFRMTSGDTWSKINLLLKSIRQGFWKYWNINFFLFVKSSLTTDLSPCDILKGTNVLILRSVRCQPTNANQNCLFCESGRGMYNQICQTFQQ